MEIPARPTMDVSPARQDRDIRVEVQRRLRQVTAESEELSSRVLEQTCHGSMEERQENPG